MVGRRLLPLAALLCTVYAKKFTVLRLTPQDKDSVDFLQKFYLEDSNKFDFWKSPTDPGQEVHVMVSDERVDPFKRMLDDKNITQAVMIEDVQKVIEKQEEKRQALRAEKRFRDWRDGKVQFNLAQYHSFADVINYLNALAVTYPERVAVQPIGTTHEGRQIPLIRIGNKRNGVAKRQIWVDGGIHAREWVSPSTVLYFIHELVTQYDKDPVVRQLVDNVDWHIVPLLNPDGYEYSRSSTDPEIRLWRKNRSPARCIQTSNGPFSAPSTQCCQGVDLNRNFDWFFSQVGASNDPCSEIYNGAFAFSEPETRSVRDYVARHPMNAFLTFHSYSQILMYPFGHQVRTYSNDLNDLRSTALSAAAALKRMYGTDYKVGTGADTLYPASGGSEDWAKGKAHVKYAYLFELRPEEQVWDGFLLAENQIMPTARETWEAVKVIAQQAMQQPVPAGAVQPARARDNVAGRQPHAPRASPVCVDRDSLCASWAQGGACETWPMMRERCPRSCGLCPAA